MVEVTTYPPVFLSEPQQLWQLSLVWENTGLKPVAHTKSCRHTQVKEKDQELLNGSPWLHCVQGKCAALSGLRPEHRGAEIFSDVMKCSGCWEETVADWLCKPGGWVLLLFQSWHCNDESVYTPEMILILMQDHRIHIKKHLSPMGAIFFRHMHTREARVWRFSHCWQHCY